MKKVEKIQLKYKKAKLADGAIDAVKNADEEDLRVLLAAILLADEESSEVDTARLCEGLDISDSEFSASLKYWKGAGVLSVPRKSAEKAQKEQAPKDTKETTAKKPKIESAHKDGKVDKETLPTYTTEELTDLMKKRKITSAFIGEASRVYGKIFNQHEVEIVVRMIDYLGLDKECVLLLLSHYAKQKRPLRYIEKAAIAFYDDGISTALQLEEKLCAMERVKDAESQIRSLFGMNSRALTTKEKKYITAWVEKMGFDIEMIRLAYDKTVDVTHEPSTAYANGILERWYADGIDTPEKVAAADEKRGEGKAGRVERSFDTDDFFEAALRRSYEGD